MAQDASGEKVGMQALPSWLAAAVGTAEVRARGGEQAGVLRGAAVRDGCSDRFALGITAACLRLCRPFLAGQLQHLARLSWKYYLTHPERYIPLATRQFNCSILAGLAHCGFLWLRYRHPSRKWVAVPYLALTWVLKNIISMPAGSLATYAMHGSSSL